MYEIFRIILFRIFSPGRQYITKIKKKTNHTFKVRAEVMGHVKAMDDGSWSLLLNPCQWIFYHAVERKLCLKIFKIKVVSSLLFCK